MARRGMTRGRARVVVGVILPILGACSSKATDQALPTDRRPPGTPAATVATPVTGARLPTTDAAPADPSDTTAVTQASASPTIPAPDPSTTTTEPLVTTGAVVMVANASNVDGAASRLTARLDSLGFSTQKATTADGIESQLATTKIYVKPGSEAVARSVARVLGVSELAYMPTPISIRGGPINLGAATIVVMLGADKAGGF